jgi:hypothetical protein
MEFVCLFVCLLCEDGMGSGGTIYVQSLMRIDTGVQVKLRGLPSNLRDCNVGITDSRQL